MAMSICSGCGTIGTPKKKTSGSFIIEVFLWLCFIVPGLIYSLWRLTTKRKVCRACGGESMIPVNSPMGRKLQQDLCRQTTPPPLK